MDVFNVIINNKIFKLNNPISIKEFIIINKLNSYNECIAAIVNNIIVDINYIIKENIKLYLIMNYSKIGLKIIGELNSYILGLSIKKIFPKSNLIKFGSDTKGLFFYDFYTELKIDENKIKLIENNMIEIHKEKIILSKKIFSYKEIKKIFLDRDEKLKILFIRKNKNYLNTNYTLSFFKNYIDILNIPNIENTNLINNFQLKFNILNIWYGFKINRIIKRIYGNVLYKEIKNNDNLKLKVNNITENRDHRILNNTLNLYYIKKKLPGMIFWKKNGLIIFNELKKLINQKLSKYEYNEVITPILMNKNIWEKTGHSKYYNKNMFNIKLDNKDYCIKPMNCPGHISIFNSKIRSYRDLPYKISEFGNCHRNELSGSIHGLMRTRGFFQDDGHIFCSKDQINDEIKSCINIMYDIYTIFGFYNIKVNLSTRPENKIGNNELWDFSEKTMSNILNKLNINFDYKIGEGAFYGPKIEFILLDYLNREWQCGTIQLDFFLSNRLKANYIDKENKKQSAIIIHRAILGSIERFIGIITEEYYGKFPLWLSPIQIVLINITKNQINYINKLYKKIEKHGIRLKVDSRNERLEYKIRDNSLLNIPYMFICGDNEVKKNVVNVRTNDGNNLGLFKLNSILKKIKNKILNRNLLYNEE